MYMYRKVYQFIGSIKLAIPLLSIIGVVLIPATFLEAQVGSETVQQEIYKSPWFGSLMFLLAVNLGVSAFNRYPWPSLRKMGFALTHLGLIVLIAGTAAVIHLSVEGMLLLRTDSGPNQIIRLGGDRLELATPDGNVHQANVFVKANGAVTPAMWTSKIRIIEGDRSLSKDVWMNHPVRYHGWKISQASWNPGDLQQSTLQVKREPLWADIMIWSGSLLVISGITVMFYGRAIAQKMQELVRFAVSPPEVQTPAS